MAEQELGAVAKRLRANSLFGLWMLFVMAAAHSAGGRVSRCVGGATERLLGEGGVGAAVAELLLEEAFGEGDCYVDSSFDAYFY